MKYDVVVCCASATLCIASALEGRMAIAAALFAVCSACFLAEGTRHAGAGAAERDAVQFIDNVLENYSDSTNTIALLKRSLNGRFVFCKEMTDAMRAYTLSSNARQAFSGLLQYGSQALTGIVSAVTNRLDNGAELRMQLLEVRKHAARRNGNSLRNTTMLGSALSVTEIGSVLFFPIFAGISLNILRFTASIQSAGYPDGHALVAVFAFFIVYLNVLNSKYNMKERVSARAKKSALSCALAILVFKVASALSIGML
jgi:hypothetical protein